MEVTLLAQTDLFAQEVEDKAKQNIDSKFGLSVVRSKCCYFQHPRTHTDLMSQIRN